MQQSCGTLLWVTHVLRCNVIWPHKLTVLKPQLPETASRTTFALQSLQSCHFQRSLLAALHFHYPVVSSEATSLRSYITCHKQLPALRVYYQMASSEATCFPHYMCTTSCQFWGHSSQKLLSLLHLYCQVASPEATPQLPAAASTLHLRYKVATSEGHSCGALLRDTLVRHSCRSAHSCRHSCGTLSCTLL